MSQAQRPAGDDAVTMNEAFLVTTTTDGPTRHEWVSLLQTRRRAALWFSIVDHVHAWEDGERGERTNQQDRLCDAIAEYYDQAVSQAQRSSPSPARPYSGGDAWVT